jgi:hypothetical protein
VYQWGSKKPIHSWDELGMIEDFTMDGLNNYGLYGNIWINYDII